MPYTAQDADGLKPVTIMLPNMAVPSIAVEILPFGLHLTQILLNADGKSNDVLIGPLDNRTLKETRPFLNCVVGRYCNRLPVGQFPVEKDGDKGVVKTISTESPTVCLHGGPVGFDRLVWTRISASDSTNFSLPERNRLALRDPDSYAIFSLTSPSGDQGFPGTLYTEVLFACLTFPRHPIRPDGVIDVGQLAIVYRSRLAPGQEGVATPINLTQHWGFNLSASGEPQKPNVNSHNLKIDSRGTIDLTPVFLASGNITPTAPGGAYDHTQGKEIGQAAPAKGYDEFYLFKNAQNEGQPIHLALDKLEKGDLLGEIFSESKREIPVKLYSNESGIGAEFQTNQPGVQLYTGEGLDGSGTKKRIHGGTADGPGYNKRSAAFLEFHEPHAAWLQSWGSTPETSTILSSKEMYHNFTKVTFTYKEER
ncbi:galactose mutarotase-like protein [Dacryopinax primogenitus]|uniref:Galactose mutarotase-like protein n=1 Tax=Dacryopinax primogenitus (strain DJM 731) TaxID=1858805 RepID=M5G3T7_DACPD|nr:galactose mutarotase-like protein [Dacryopinax primogenitus]EJU04911.1 galactose mutarotase-like protein [Dacryopinax primogenitus]